jgi:aldose 1-epimerase
MTVVDSESAGLLEHELVNRHGDRVRLLNFGARIAAIQLALPDGPRNIALGYADSRDYLDDRFFMGATVGRFCNRIRAARFAIGESTYSLAANEGIHQLHGGPRGFDRLYWHIDSADASQASFRLFSADGDQGYPGSLQVLLNYRWSDRRCLRIHYSASCDKPTFVNLSNHCYFNLDADSRTILDHSVRIDADHITDIDAEKLPTGTLLPVSGTDMDLSSGRTIRELVSSDDVHLHSAAGPDLNYILRNRQQAATVHNATGDLSMSVATSCPGLQLYSGQYLEAPFQRYAGFCLESQYFPDSPNQPAFPSTLLQPGESFDEYTEYRFLASADD